MDNNFTLDSNLGGGSLDLTQEAIGYLKTTAKWANFLAIIGFIGVGFMVLAALFVGTFMSSMSDFSEISPLIGSGFGLAMTILYLIIAALYFFPTLYLYRFATKTKAAIRDYQTHNLTEGLKNLKSSFKFVGIMIAVILGLYALILVFAIVGGGIAALS